MDGQVLATQLFGTQLVHCVVRGPEQVLHVDEHGWHTRSLSAKKRSGQRVRHWPLSEYAWEPIDSHLVHWFAPGPKHESPQEAWQGRHTPDELGAYLAGHWSTHRPLSSRGRVPPQLVHILLVASHVACKVALQSLGQLICTLHSRSRQFEAPLSHEG